MPRPRPTGNGNITGWFVGAAYMPPVAAIPIVRYNGVTRTGRIYASPTNLPEVRNIPIKFFNSQQKGRCPRQRPSLFCLRRTAQTPPYLLSIIFYLLSKFVILPRTPNSYPLGSKPRTRFRSPKPDPQCARRTRPAGTPPARWKISSPVWQPPCWRC